MQSTAKKFEEFMHHPIRKTRFVSAAIAAGFSLLAMQAHAGEPLCTPALKLDKEKLATWLLDNHPVSTAYLGKGSQRAPLDNNSALLAWLLKKRAANPGDTSRDGATVDLLARDMQAILDGKNEQFTTASKAKPAAWFASGNRSDEIRCTVATAQPVLSTPTSGTGSAGSTAVAAAPAPAPAAAAPAKPAAPPAVIPGFAVTQSVFGNFRLRGNPDQLAIDRDNVGAYSSADKATLALANDTVAGSRTNDIRAYLGYSAIKDVWNDKGSSFEAVPYVGLRQNRVIVNNNGNQSTNTTRTTNVGILTNFHLVYGEPGNYDDITARPDFLMDSSTGTRLLSFNFTYTPLRKGFLNDLIRTDYGVSVKPILIGESRNGTYLDRGDETVSDSHDDFMRIGGRAGFGLISNNPVIPLDYVMTYTALKSVVGDKNIHYLKGALTYNFSQTVGLSLNYSNGLLPDTGDREKRWNLGITSKF